MPPKLDLSLKLPPRPDEPETAEYYRRQLAEAGPEFEDYESTSYAASTLAGHVDDVGLYDPHSPPRRSPEPAPKNSRRTILSPRLTDPTGIRTSSPADRSAPARKRTWTQNPSRRTPVTARGLKPGADGARWSRGAGRGRQRPRLPRPSR